MKKIVSLTLAVAMIICCCAVFGSCGNKTTEGETATTVADNAILADGTLDMATNASFPPYEYKEGEGFAGIDVDVAGKIAEKLGVELVVHDIDFNSIITGIQTAKYDMGMAGMTVTDERKKSVNFTKTYAKGIQVVIVKDDSAIKTVDDLSTVKDKIGTQDATTGYIYASADVADGGYGSDRVIGYKTGNDAVQALVSGKVGAVIIDNEPAKSYVAANKGLKILPTAYADEDYAICVAKENTELLAKIDAALDELKADGTLQSIVDKYIPADNTATTAAK